MDADEWAALYCMKFDLDSHSIWGKGEEEFLRQMWKELQYSPEAVELANRRMKYVGTITSRDPALLAYAFVLEKLKPVVDRP